MADVFIANTNYGLINVNVLI